MNNPVSPSRDYRENSARAIYIDQEFDFSLYKRVSREFHVLRSQSSDPITIYISSGGGRVDVFDLFKSLFWTPDQGGVRPRIITVANGFAASAAARLLVLGDYSLSYSGSVIHCHGTRISQAEDVTRESAEAISRRMEDSNRAAADDFVRKILSNLAFLFDSNRSELEKISEDEKVNPVVAFSIMIHERLSLRASSIMEGVFQDLDESAHLEQFLNTGRRSKSIRSARSRSNTDHQRTVLKHIIDFLHDRRWKNEHRLTDEFSSHLRRLFKSRIDSSGPEFFGYDNWLKIMPLILKQEEFEQFLDAHRQGREVFSKYFTANVAPVMNPLWQLASSIANRLVVGENPLTALDAYWLGLVQEVIGSELPSMRVIAEATPEALTTAGAKKAAAKVPTKGAAKVPAKVPTKAAAKVPTKAAAKIAPKA